MKLMVRANNWDKTTNDSTLFIVKNILSKDHKKSSVNNNDDLFKKYFYISIFKVKSVARTIVFSTFK